MIIPLTIYQLQLPKSNYRAYAIKYTAINKATRSYSSSITERNKKYRILKNT